MNDDSAAMAHIVGPLLVAVLVFSIVTPAFADRDEATAALRRGDFPAALAAFQPLAGAGDAASQFDRGVLHQHSWGTSRDTATAIAWYTKAAKQGYFLVQHNLGVIYFYGRGIPQNDVKAYLWFSLAAEAPHVTAATNRDIIAARMSATERAEAEALVKAWQRGVGE